MENKFYGKYRGTVSDNKDPTMMGKIRAKVSDVMGDRGERLGYAARSFGRR